MTSLTGRADLLHLLLESDHDADLVAELLGYKREKERVRAPDEPGIAVTKRPVEFLGSGLAPVPFHVARGYKALGSANDVSDDSVRTTSRAERVPVWNNRPATAPEPQPIGTEKTVATRIHRQIGSFEPGGALDVDAAVERVAVGEVVSEIPRRRRRISVAELDIIVDRSLGLVPFYQDQVRLVGEIKKQFPHTVLNIALYDDATGIVSGFPGKRKAAPLDLALVNPCVLITDVSAGNQVHWRSVGRRLRQRGLPAIAVLPFAGPVDDTFRSLWTIEVLDQRRPPDGAEDAVRRILAFASFAVRLEPALLRALRLALIPEAGIAVEALAWQSRYLLSRHPQAATLDLDAFSEDRDRLLRLEPELCKSVLRIIRSYRVGLDDAVWFDEILSLGSAARDVLEHSDDIEDAEAFIGWIAEGLHAGGGTVSRDQLAWLSRVAGRVEKNARAFEQPGLREAVMLLKADDGRYQPNIRPEDAPSGTKSLGNLFLSLQRGALVASPPDAIDVGSRLAILPSDNGFFELVHKADFASSVAANECPPWADEAGEDEYGRWLKFSFAGVSQIMRWCPPGRFVMGSPEDEPGRYDDESPQTEIAIDLGFWLFDSPVTQKLYEAVMGENPSRFKSPDRPVENVSFEDAERFMAGLNGALPGLDLCLPGEAQWEYACRAGTLEATYAGAMEIAGENNAPVLDAVAWYGGNSGVDFDLDNGVDSSDWPEKQFDHNMAGTRSIKMKAPNRWGLYDMLGNVDEWCVDDWSSTHDGADAVGASRLVSGKDEDGEWGRVVRGGSWYSVARYCRAAFRTGVEPDFRNDDLGFRPARGQVRPEVGGPEGQARAAEPRAGQGDFPGVGDPGESLVRRRVLPGRSADVPLPAGPFVIRTDRAELTIARQTLEDLSWASAKGRDRFGLWAEFRYGNVGQRLRWCPPGRFVMGSREGEPGRWDDEGPQTEITFEAGFWLFDCPVTQKLYEAVTGANPSEYRSPERPVETVSFEDAETFIVRLNERLPGLDLCLPSEAQWEYACRAGTVEATYAGSMEIVGDRNAPVLDAIAWYGGNSGVEFDLDDGFDSSDWNEKQFAHSVAGTRKVKRKAPNGWGLHDMLGNVDEWCADEWNENHDEANVFGAPRLFSGEKEGGGRSRVVRGGSWGDEARGCRAACRNGGEPDDRDALLGFRPARGQVTGASRKAGGPEGQGRVAEPRAERGEKGNVKSTGSNPEISGDRQRGKD